MVEQPRKVTFANEKFESDFKRLANSEDPADRKLYSVLRRIREKVKTDFALGKKVPLEEIPAVYVERFDIENLWKLETSKGEIVYYSFTDGDIQIVDID